MPKLTAEERNQYDVSLAIDIEAKMLELYAVIKKAETYGLSVRMCAETNNQYFGWLDVYRHFKRNSKRVYGTKKLVNKDAA